jgi:hypothetical protein
VTWITAQREIVGLAMIVPTSHGVEHDLSRQENLICGGATRQCLTVRMRLCQNFRTNLVKSCDSIGRFAVWFAFVDTGVPLPHGGRGQGPDETIVGSQIIA